MSDLRSILHDPYAFSNNKSDFLFIHIPKTAGTSIANALGIRPAHIPASRFYAADRNKFDASYKIAFVRNPWIRLSSAYNYLRSSVELKSNAPDILWARENLERFESFEEFVHFINDPQKAKIILNYIHFRPQMDWISMPGQKKHMMDTLGKFENLEQDVKTLFDHLKIFSPLEHTRKPVAKHVTPTLTSDMIKIVEKIYEHDIRALEYENEYPNAV